MGESRGRYRAEYDAPAVKRINKALIKYGNGVGQSLGSSNIFEFLFIAAIAVLIYAWLISRDRRPLLRASQDVRSPEFWVQHGGIGRHLNTSTHIEAEKRARSGNAKSRTRLGHIAK
jgi:hypothetical protein